MICVFREWGGETVELQPWFCSFCPDRSSHWWLWAQLKVFPHLNVTPVPEHWPTWKPKRWRRRSSHQKLPPFPSRHCWLYLHPSSNSQGQFHLENTALGVWDWGPSGEGVWWAEEQVKKALTESPFSEYSCKSVTPRAQIWGWQL